MLISYIQTSYWTIQEKKQYRRVALLITETPAQEVAIPEVVQAQVVAAPGAVQVPAVAALVGAVQVPAVEAALVVAVQVPAVAEALMEAADQLLKEQEV